MFGFSLPKLLFTALVVVVVWMVFSWATRRVAPPSDSSARPGRGRGRGSGHRAEDAAAPPPPPLKATVDLVACPRCGKYIPQGTVCSCQTEEKEK